MNEKFHRRALFLFHRYQRCEISMRAAALAYHTVLGIVPTLGMLFWYLESTPLQKKWLTQTRTFIVQHLTVDSGTTFATQFEKLTSQVHGHSWGWIGLFIFIYTTWNLVARFGSSLDFILTSRETETPPEPIGLLLLFGKRAMAMLVLPVALALSVVLSSWVKEDSWFHYILEFKTIGKFIAIPTAWLGAILSATLIYFFIPSQPVKLRQALKAGLVAGPLSEIVRYGFGLYNVRAVSVHKIYGVLAVIPMFILWIQVAWTILLASALLIELIPRGPKQEVA